MRRIYLDHNATTPADPQVVAAMLPFLTEIYGNASSIHSFGQQARAAVEQARESVARLVAARPAEIVFTSGGTEADNLAIFGVVRASRAGRKHVVTSQIEHHAVLNTCQALETEGVEVTYVPVGADGVVDPALVRAALRPHTVLVSVMLANNELGTIQPVAEIAKIAAEAGATFHTDAVQAAGKFPVDVSRLSADLLSLSGHKIYAPKGVGALYVRSGTRLAPIAFGGHHERDRRAGTENVPGIVALGCAARLALERLDSEPAHIAALRDRFERELLARIPEVCVNGSGAPRVANTSNVTFRFIEGESLVIALDLKGVSCSTGAACSSGAIEPSHVLTAIGLSPRDARSSLRFSFGHANTEADVDAVLDALESAVSHLRELSPLAPRSARS